MGRFVRVTRDDAGMTIVEIMIAAMILFIVMTALLGLLLQTTRMAQQTKMMTVATNAVTSYMEEIRALPYEEVGVGGTALPGSVPGTRTVEADGYEIVMRQTVDWVDDENIDGVTDYKQVRIDATVTTVGITAPVEYSTVTFVWGAPYEAAEIEPPDVTFTLNTPAANSVVYGTAVRVSGHAETDAPGGSIAKFIFKVDSEFMPDSSTPPLYGDWTPETTPVDQTWLWDTTATQLVVDAAGEPILDGEGNMQYSPFSPDGTRVIKCEVWDNLAQTNYVTRLVVVDNFAPSPSSGAALAAQYSTGLSASWNQASDGTDSAASYNVSLARQPLTNTDSSAWPVVSTNNVAATTLSLTGAPFSRYLVWVQAQGPAPRSLTSTWVTSSVATTRPELSGSFTRTITKSGSGSKATYTVRTIPVEDVSNPTFAKTGAVLYELWRGTSLVGLGTGSPYATGITFDSGTWTETINDPVAYKSNNTTPSYYYLVRATFTPFGSTSTQSLTNVAFVPGVTVSAAGTTTGTMTQQW